MTSFRSSNEMAEMARELFKDASSRSGWSATVANISTDSKEHWGFLIQKENEASRLVDVRSRKRLNRSDIEPQDEWQWIELHGVQPNDNGWLFNRKSEWIAFETATSFIIVDRKRLIRFVEENVDMTSLVTAPSEARYKVYSRNKRSDALTLVETKRLQMFAEVIWTK